MKYYENTFFEYVNCAKKKNLHEELLELFSYFPDKVKDLNNLIFYGPSGTGKYTQALYCIQKYSSYDLKYKRKIKIVNKRDYQFRVSDIHFEIDMQLLGCNAKILWNTIYYHILDILSTKASPEGIIICKNFHCIHSELLEVFFSYMENLIPISLKYILITEHLSFLPENIINSCKIINVKRPTKTQYFKITKQKIPKNQLKFITNIKNIKSNITQLNHIPKLICIKILNKIINYKNLNYIQLRDSLYDIFIYQLDVQEVIFYIINDLIQKKRLDDEKLLLVFERIFSFLKYFNNNYRPIYHLESFFLFLCKTIHNIEDTHNPSTTKLLT